MTQSEAARSKIRIDKWLWQARFFKSRGLAGDVAGSGAVRVNGDRIAKAAHAVRAGDVLTFPQSGRIRVIRVLELGTRRGPAAEAQGLYEDLEPSAGLADPGIASAPAPGASAGRPGKRDRRDILALRRRDP